MQIVHCLVKLPSSPANLLTMLFSNKLCCLAFFTLGQSSVGLIFRQHDVSWNPGLWQQSDFFRKARHREIAWASWSEFKSFCCNKIDVFVFKHNAEALTLDGGGKTYRYKCHWQGQFWQPSWKTCERWKEPKFLLTDLIAYWCTV